MENIKGFKVFNSDWTCRGFQYEIGHTYEENVIPKCCDRGFHFCIKASDCFNYYSFNSDNKVAEVIALGELDTSNDDSKCSTNKIQIVREISWSEVLELVNIGKECTGFGNSGNWNSGNWNSGDCNSGNRNSGNWNSGDRNSGDWNKSNCSNGVFNTVRQPILMFNKPTKMTFEQWRNSDAYCLLDNINFRPTEWIWVSDMTEEEKKAHPDWEVCEGYLKVLDTSDCCKEWWNGLSMDKKCIIQNIPNFDTVIFEEITGIKVDE